MEHSEYYEADVLAYFSGKPEELALYETVYAQLCRAFPDASVKVQKSQISFYNRHLFAAVSLPVRRKKDWPKTCILVTFGLFRRLDDPRIAVAVEPYPDHWTHHVVLSDSAQADSQLMAWLEEAYTCAMSKR